MLQIPFAPREDACGAAHGKLISTIFSDASVLRKSEMSRCGQTGQGQGEERGKWRTSEPTGRAAGPLDGLWPHLGRDGILTIDPSCRLCRGNHLLC